MAFREKVLWCSMLTTLLVWGAYFYTLAGDLEGGVVHFGVHAGRFVTAVIAVVVIQVATQVTLGIRYYREARDKLDDRERDFALTGYRAGFVALSCQVVAIMLATPVIVPVALKLLDGDAAAIASVVLGNAMLFAVVLAELVQSGWQIARFRMGG